MEEYLIQRIHNGWILRGPNVNRQGEYVSSTNKELFLPTISAVADILTTWSLEGFGKAASLARKKYGGENG